MTTMTERADDGTLIQSARTTLRVLEALRDVEEAGVTEISERLDVPKSSVHNYLTTLEAEGYVVKEGGRYRLGLRFLDLGAAARNRWAVYKIAKAEVSRLARETGELANLAVAESGEVVYLFRNCGANSINVDVSTGSRCAMHATAPGKAILAHRPDEEVDRVIEQHGLAAHTATTITDRPDLYEELERVRDRGIAFDREERIDGLNGVAAPIKDGDRAVGAISVAGPTSRLKGDRLTEAVPDLLRDAANVVELNVTFSE